MAELFDLDCIFRVTWGVYVILCAVPPSSKFGFGCRLSTGSLEAPLGLSNAANLRELQLSFSVAFSNPAILMLGIFCGMIDAWSLWLQHQR